MAIVIYGTQGSGKTVFAQQLVVHFNAAGVVDDWDGLTEIPEGYLALTSVPVAGAIPIAEVLPLLSARS